MNEKQHAVLEHGKSSPVLSWSVIVQARDEQWCNLRLQVSLYAVPCRDRGDAGAKVGVNVTGFICNEKWNHNKSVETVWQYMNYSIGWDQNTNNYTVSFERASCIEYFIIYIAKNAVVT